MQKKELNVNGQVVTIYRKDNTVITDSDIETATSFAINNSIVGSTISISGLCMEFGELNNSSDGSGDSFNNISNSTIDI